MKSIFKNVAIITAFSVLTRFLGFLFRIYLSRTIGAEELGRYQVALSVFLVLLTIVSSGFTFVISRMTAGYRVREDKRLSRSLWTSSLIVVLSASIILCLIVFAFQFLFAKIFTDENCLKILIILLPSLIFSSIYSVFRGAMWGNDKYFGLCVSEFGEQVAKIVFFVLLIGSGVSALGGAFSVAWAFTLSCVFSSILVVVLFFCYGGRLGKPTKIWKELVKRSAPITGVRVLGSLSQPLIALILPARLIAAGYTKSQAISIYGVAIGMTFPLLFLPATLIGSLATALVPDISMALEKKDFLHIEKRVHTAVMFTLFISFLVVPVFIAVGDKIGIFLYDNALSGTLLQFSAWMMIPMGLTNISSAILNSLGFEVKSFINYLTGDSIMFLVLLTLPKLIGINALIVGMGLSSVVSTILNFAMLKKKLNIEVKFLSKLAVLILLSLPTIALTSFLSAIFAHFISLASTLAFSCTIGIFVFLILGTTFGTFNFSSFLVAIKTKFARKKVKKI